MIIGEPTASGNELLLKMRNNVPSLGEVVLWPLGQAGFKLVFPAATVYIDLYLSNHCEAVLPRPFDHRRSLRAPLDAAQIVDADVVLSTHGHLDHCDWPTIRTLADASPFAHLVTPAPNVPTVLALDWPSTRVHGSTTAKIQLGPISVHPIRVAHDDYDEQQDGFPYQGFVVSDGVTVVAHVGDARLDDNLVSSLRRYDVDVLLVPINGRSPARHAMGFAGNMNAAEAYSLGRSLDVPYLVPMHFDMFEQNTDPGALANLLSFSTQTDRPTVLYAPVGEHLTVRADRTN